MRKLSFLLILTHITLFSCRSVSKINEDFISVEELGYGICSTVMYESKNLSNSPTGFRMVGYKYLNITKKTDSVYLDDKVQFGVEYKINSPKTKMIPIQTVWKYPNGMKDQYGNPLKETRYFINKKTNTYNYSNYTLGPRGTMVTGDWVLELYYKNKLIYTRTFHLI